MSPARWHAGANRDDRRLRACDGDVTAATLAGELVREVDVARQSSGGMGWLIWIGVIIGINVLAWAFGWPIWMI
jgi:hypothetical protein